MSNYLQHSGYKLSIITFTLLGLPTTSSLSTSNSQPPNNHLSAIANLYTLASIFKRLRFGRDHASPTDKVIPHYLIQPTGQRSQLTSARFQLDMHASIHSPIPHRQTSASNLQPPNSERSPIAPPSLQEYNRRQYRTTETNPVPLSPKEPPEPDPQQVSSQGTPELSRHRERAGRSVLPARQSILGSHGIPVCPFPVSVRLNKSPAPITFLTHRFKFIVPHPGGGGSNIPRQASTNIPVFHHHTTHPPLTPSP